MGAEASEVTPDEGGDAALSRALTTASDLLSATGRLEADSIATTARLRVLLRDPARRHAVLALLGALHTDFTVALADQLVAVALSHRYALEVRQLFARLPRDELVGIVPTAVSRQLAETPDDDAYRRLAELLDYVGHDEALRELCLAAAESDDPALREVGEEFMP